MFDTLAKVLSFLEPRDKKRALLLLILMAFGACLETIGIGLLIPFITVASNPGLIQKQAQLQSAYRLLGQPGERVFFIQIGIALIAVFAFKNVYSVCLSFVQGRYLLNREIALERKLYSSYLHRNYTFHLNRSSAELYQNIRNISAIITNVGLPILSALAEGFILVGMVGMLVYFKPLTTLLAVFILGSFTFAFYALIRKKLRRVGEDQQHYGILFNRWIYQGYGGIKEVKILGKEDFFTDQAMIQSYKFAGAGLKGIILGGLPKPMIEFLGFTGIILFIFGFLFTGHGAEYVVPTLVLFAGTSVRIMPSINRIVGASLSVRQASSIVDILHRDLQEANQLGNSTARASSGPWPFLHLEREIEFKKVSYQYPEAKSQSLREVSFTIPRGQSVAFVGHSGAGKTTVIDVLLGLLPEFQGEVLIDSQSIRTNLRGWQSNVGYIPQSIYISDDTLRRNIAFGETDENIDENRVIEAVKLASLEEVVSNLPFGLGTTLGDRGVRLSGGQRQRIGIARALYRNPEVLVLDEATSALDNETEKEITLAIDQLSGAKTIVVIAHRLSTVAHCDTLYFMQEGSIVDSGKFEELLNKNERFKKFSSPTET